MCSACNLVVDARNVTFQPDGTLICTRRPGEVHRELLFQPIPPEANSLKGAYVLGREPGDHNGLGGDMRMLHQRFLNGNSNVQNIKYATHDRFFSRVHLLIKVDSSVDQNRAGFPHQGITNFSLSLTKVGGSDTRVNNTEISSKTEQKFSLFDSFYVVENPIPLASLIIKAKQKETAKLTPKDFRIGFNIVRILENVKIHQALYFKNKERQLIDDISSKRLANKNLNQKYLSYQLILPILSPLGMILANFSHNPLSSLIIIIPLAVLGWRIQTKKAKINDLFSGEEKKLNNDLSTLREENKIREQNYQQVQRCPACEASLSSAGRISKIIEQHLNGQLGCGNGNCNAVLFLP